MIEEREVVDALTVRELSNRLPREELGAMLLRALRNAERGAKFSEADLLATTPPRVIVQHVPLTQIWDALIGPRIAQHQGFELTTEILIIPKAASPEATADRREGGVVPIALKAGAPSKQAAGATPKPTSQAVVSANNRVAAKPANTPFDDDVTRVFEDDDDTSVFELIEDDAKAV
ncbi:MAG TPA: hypothetical protein VHC69_15495 [Polyangiaceae bacterium]|nr:hypothetical protein [Polyangiaceae bacterium]